MLGRLGLIDMTPQEPRYPGMETVKLSQDGEYFVAFEVGGSFARFGSSGDMGSGQGMTSWRFNSAHEREIFLIKTGLGRLLSEASSSRDYYKAVLDRERSWWMALRWFGKRKTERLAVRLSKLH